MTYRTPSLLALASVLTIAACGPGEDAADELEVPGDEVAEEPTDVRETPMPEYTETVQSDFTSGEEAEVEIIGTLHLMEPTSAAAPGAPLRIRVQMSGLPAGEHAWHIHAGPCDASAEVAVALTATEEQDGITQPLTSDDMGVAEAEVEVPGLAERWMGSGDHSVHVHEGSGTDFGPSIACATL